MSARAIAQIRQALAASWISVGSGTGYDDARAAAVSIYHGQHGLKVDGKVEPETALHMGFGL